MPRHLSFSGLTSDNLAAARPTLEPSDSALAAGFADMELDLQTCERLGWVLKRVLKKGWVICQI